MVLFEKLVLKDSVEINATPEKIWEFWSNMDKNYKAWHPKDHILRTPVRGWAERKQIKPASIDYSQYTCPLIDSISRAAFIAPDGTWYACCWDGNNELALGNVIEKSIHQVFLSDRRRHLLQLLENRDFAKISGPCTTVNCCQALSCN